jgi:hypothetical protein
MAISSKPTYGESEGRTATKAFRKRDLPTDQAQAPQPEWDVPQWGCSRFPQSVDCSVRRLFGI